MTKKDIMFTPNQSKFLETLKHILSTEQSLQKKQKELEKNLIPKDRSDNLMWLPQTDTEVILNAKLKALNFTKDILKTTKITPDMNFLTSDFLVSITLNILIKMFSKISKKGSGFSYVALVRAVNDHFITQISWQHKIRINHVVPTPEEELKIKTLNKKISRILACKVVDILEPSGIIQINHKKFKDKEKFKTQKSIVLSNGWFTLAQKQNFRLTILPMIYPPQNWKLVSTQGENKLIDGGYLYTAEIPGLTTSLLESSNQIFKVKHSELSQSNINYLQSIPYGINAKLLEQMQADPKTIPQYQDAFNLIGNETRENFCGVLDDFSLDKAFVYDTNKLLLEHILYTLDLLELYKRKSIYFPLSHDGRGRLYPICYPIATTAPNYIRSLIECHEPYTFSSTDYPKEWESFLNILASRLDTNVANFKKNPKRYIKYLCSKPIEDFSIFILWEIYKSRKLFMSNCLYTSALIGFDVTASGLQIMSLICSSKKGLYLTNVFNSIKEQECDDIYELIQQHVINLCPIMTYMTRNEYKQIIMKLSYGESTYSRRDAIKAYFSRIDFNRKTQKEHMIKLKYTEDEIKEGVPSSYTIAEMYETAIYAEFPTFKRLKENLLEIIEFRSSVNLPIIFNISETYRTSQYYNLDLATTYTYRDHKNVSKKLKMYIPKTLTDENKVTKRFDAIPDIKKMRRATMPNFIHHLDSLILQEVVSVFRTKDLPIFTLHDAFYCRLIDIELLKKTYFEALQEINKIDPWQRLLECNKITESEAAVTNLTKQEINTFNSRLDEIIKQVPKRVEFESMSDEILRY